MSSSKTVNNLNIRKFPTLSSYKAATIDQDDLCLVLDGKPVVRVTTLPTASADYLDEVYQYTGTNGQYRTNCFYRCYTNGTEYYWDPIAVQDPSTAEWRTKFDQLSGVISEALSNIVFTASIASYQPSSSQIVNRLFYIDLNEDTTGATTTNHFCAEIYIGLGGTSYQNVLHASGDFANLKAFLFTDSNNFQHLGLKNPDGTDIFAEGSNKEYKMLISYFGVDAVNDYMWCTNNFNSVSETQIPDKPSGGATYTAGNGISIDANNEISVTDPVLKNLASVNTSLNIGTTTSTDRGMATSVGINAVCNNSGVAIGYKSKTTSFFGGIAIGPYASSEANSAIQLGNGFNAVDNTFKVGNANGNYELMSADGTVPTARLTKVNTTATLAVADWSSNTQTVTASGVKADSVVFVSPAPASASDYASAGILCTAQAADSLTFTATTTPTNAITVNVVCL